MSRTAATHVAPAVASFLLAQRHRGACTEQTAALFFDDGRPAGRGARARHEAAKAICRLCPILDACRAYARADPTLEGIWGGETQDERHLARRQGADPGPAAENEPGRRLASLAVKLAERDGLDAAAAALKVPPATLRRVVALYGLDQPPGPASPLAAPKGGEPAWPPRQPPAASTPITTSSWRPGRRSRSSSPSRAGQPPARLAAPARPTTPATRPPDRPPILPASRPTPVRQGAIT
jgi:WhiB family transcriptional regulator, redox-sensing transcriptional regulator